MTGGSNAESVSIGQVVDYLLSGSSTNRRELARWPPDVFAVVGSILKQSGCYIEVVNDWPPHGTISSWASNMEANGRAWRARTASDCDCPPNIQAWWDVVLKAAGAGALVCDVHADSGLFQALVALLASSDEACGGVGIVDETKAEDQFLFKALEELSVSEDRGFGSSLCREIHPSVACVLPKHHTPLNGITFRSLTHHLALWTNAEVRPYWNMMELPRLTGNDFNVLILPWPLEVEPSAFSPVSRARPDMCTEFGFFTCDTRSSGTSIVDDVVAMVKEAGRRCGRVDMIVLPEACLREPEDIQLIDRLQDVLVVGGIGGVAPGGDVEVNKTVFGVRSGDLATSLRPQPKHHRWRLDKQQIDQYGLAERFQGDRKWWWEAIHVHPRTCNFYNVNTWLTACVLICEDLARQDPVAELVRNVGPSLVIGLLLDGPQIAGRWPTRYATILADDPRCSVLTVTSAGAVDMTTKTGLRGRRSVALWKDAIGGVAHEIELDQDAHGVLLRLVNQFAKEWSADGRDDAGATPYLTYRDEFQIKLP